jgi:hypothetical protein
MADRAGSGGRISDLCGGRLEPAPRLVGNRRAGNDGGAGYWLACMLGCTIWLASCNFLHDGQKAFKASQEAAKRTKHFSVELDEPARLVHIKRSQALDCEVPYFYEHEELDRTAEGIEAGVSELEGRPSKHEERETLFVNGKTYAKNSSSREKAPFGSDDADTDWHPVSRPRDPSDECRAMKQGRSLGYVSYDTTLEEGRIEYLGRQRINGHRCLEYSLKFASQVLKETKVCLGTSDDLPYRVSRADYTATYSYEPVARLPVPVPAPTQTTH